ncbi:MAG: hypothetical protein JOZ62_16300 [Acidobacteriaceae bacterium]|nr:hypothetical protein [Acidobacteriaceae bacterium]
MGASSATDAANVTYTASGTGAVARTAASKLSDTLSVLDFGAKGDGSTDDTGGIHERALRLVRRATPW